MKPLCYNASNGNAGCLFQRELQVCWQSLIYRAWPFRERSFRPPQKPQAISIFSRWLNDLLTNNIPLWAQHPQLVLHLRILGSLFAGASIAEVNVLGFAPSLLQAPYEIPDSSKWTGHACLLR